ncbi:heterokaryon incompatibility protein-domain-containing protein [Dactylonectria macrodidyma]|uniref:Heterokaryon incompatibility protein-domain-containing protein n=1 Tax=Dactylonectria macrodidyma TaxID=307937 RepID=A0A9P9IH63_9HYPO|nr:heterokaryon incompatibility protein-domain-containing protein [Dactylonectria macrodidyma]
MITTNNLGADTSWEQVTSWLSHCLENHKACVHQYSESWYPTRLIDVGKPGDSMVKLCLTATSNPEGPYVTLSHRWGLGEMLKLKSGNLQQHLHGIPLADLPQTFADAIQVARSLQVQYIWIDSLCIIQDSAEDWQAESAQMNNVYRRSFLNISATGVGDSSGTGTLFRHRSLDVGWVAWTTERRKGERFLIYDREYWKEQLIDSELNRRAWVFQERMLAPRVLHFGEKQLFWECQALEACESFPRGIPPIMREPLGKSLDPAKYEERQRNMNLGPRTKPEPPLDRKVRLSYDLWTEIVSRYTPCGVTKESDKLVAISGIARQLSTTLQDEYLAGLWRSNLVECLSWMAENPEGLCRPTLYRAPSWSWASVASGVRYFYLKVPQVAVPQVTIEEVSVTPESGDYFGQIRDGFVKLRGRMIGPIEFQTVSDKVSIVSKKPTHSMLQFISVHPDHSAVLDGDKLFFMPLQKYVWENALEGFDAHIVCLILRRLPQKGSGVYERCGSMELNANDTYMVEDTSEASSEREREGWTITNSTIIIV